MVGAGLPQHVLAAHALEPRQDVLQRVVERVTHVQRAGHVGRRDHDGIRRASAAAAERAGLLPRRIDAAFDFGGLVGFFHGGGRYRRLA
jgi:hypothetical protein